MKIKDLIKKLEILPPDQEIYGYDPLCEVDRPIEDFRLGNAKVSKEIDLLNGVTEATYIRSYLVKFEK